MRAVSPRSLPILALVFVVLAGACTSTPTDDRGRRRSAATPSTSVASPRAAAEPAEEPQPDEPCVGSVRSLDLVMKPGHRVPGALTGSIRATAERAQQALARVPLPGCGRRVTIVKILTGGGAANTAAQFQQVTPKRGVITIWTDDWFDLSTMGRTFVLVHEWWHQIQQLSAWCGPDDGCPGGDVDEVPIWLLEGDANIQALRVTDLLGLTSYREYVRWHGGSTPRALAALRSDEDPLQLPPNETLQWYLMAQYAADDLVDGTPLTFLRFWRLAGKTGDWHRAFRLAFGVGYDAYVDEAFMGPDHLWS
jgi:hypothetical protein